MSQRSNHRASGEPRDETAIALPLLMRTIISNVAMSTTCYPSSLKEFCRKIPKVELHAHLNGSISSSTMRKLLQRHREREGGDAYATVPQIWETTILKGERRSLDDCFVMFKMIHTLVSDEQSVEMVAHDVVAEFAEDGVVYLEIRSTPRANPATGMTKRSYVEVVLSGIDKALLKCTTIHVRLLLSIDRCHSVAEAQDTVELASEHVSQGRATHRAWVVGIDLSGDPTVGDMSALVPVLCSAKKRGLKLAVHIAEVPHRNDEIELLLSAEPDRLGHGTFIHHDVGGSPEIEERVSSSQLPIEVCLTSNVKGQTVSNYENHHLAFWLKRGHPVVICTDDKGVFSTTLSEEYAIAGQTFSLSKQELWHLARRAVNFVFESDSLREGLRNLYEIETLNF